MIKTCVICVKERERYRLNPEPKKKRTLKRYRRHRDKINSRRYILRKLNREEHGLRFKPFCHTCGKAFKPHYKGEKYCSDKCRRQSPLYRVWLRIKSRCGY